MNAPSSLPAEQETEPTPAELPTLAEVFERYATLRDTIQGLEGEREALGSVIKAALLAGETVEGDVYRAALRRSRRLEYPVSRFREVFGDAAALEVASIDRRRAEALAKAGDLDPARLRDLAEVKEIVSLVLELKGQAGSGTETGTGTGNGSGD